MAAAMTVINKIGRTKERRDLGRQIVIMDHGLWIGERGHGGGRGPVVLKVLVRSKNCSSRKT